MSFSKVGMIKTAKVEILNNFNDWDSIKKQAKVENTTEKKEQIDKEALDKESVEKEADLQVVATVDLDKFIYIHTSIMTGVKTAENGYLIVPETEKYANDNNDGWRNEDLLSDYKTFRRATTFVEHDQRLEFAKGKCVDAIARDMGDTILIDVLFSVDKRHNDLAENIKNGIINAVSMGCTTAETTCSICGNKASEPTQYCDHMKPPNKGKMFTCSDGTKRKAIELCKKNTFYDISLVANPAFACAVFRKILSAKEITNQLLANILCSKIETHVKGNELLLKAASKDSEIATISIKQDGTIDIKTPSQQFTASESLTKEDISNFLTLIPTTTATPKTSTIDKILNKLFGREATHPILNETPKKDFSISDQDYSNIPYRNRHDTGFGKSDNNLPTLEINNPIIVLEIIPKNKEKVSRTKEFECLKCGFKTNLHEVEATSIDAGQEHTLECPQCFFASEKTLFKTAKTKKKFKIKEKVQITSKKDKNKIGEVIAYRGDLYIIKFEDGKTTWKSENDLQKLKEKKAMFIATNNIPIENDEGTLWFDEQGNSAIFKGEKVSFITTVENGEYGLFCTQSGEDFYMPMSLINSQRKQ